MPEIRKTSPPGLLICDRQAAHPWPDGAATLATEVPAWIYPRSLKHWEIQGSAVSWDLLLRYPIHQMELALPGGPPNPLM